MKGLNSLNIRNEIWRHFLKNALRLIRNTLPQSIWYVSRDLFTLFGKSVSLNHFLRFTLHCIMLLNGQIDFNNLAAFWDIMH